MMNFPKPEVVQEIRKKYPAGTRVESVSMKDPNLVVPKGTRGTVLCVDEIGTVFVSWECGFNLGAVHGIDVIKVVEK